MSSNWYRSLARPRTIHGSCKWSKKGSLKRPQPSSLIGGPKIYKPPTRRKLDRWRLDRGLITTQTITRCPYLDLTNLLSLMRSMAALKLNVKIRKMELKITRWTNSCLVLLMIRLIPHTLALIQLVCQAQMMTISKSQRGTSFYSPSSKGMRKRYLLLIKVKILPAIMVRMTFLNNSYLIALNAYLSTPKFIMTLTDLSLELIA